MPTPEYLRKVMPFAAYFAPAAFDQPRKGIYIVTPSVDGDPGAMREHNRASITNTSIHEAYPGHHLQLSAALERPTITRLLVDAPEFVEGWGMYSEQLMREHGFDATPAHRMMLATDAIWRACRIILDIRLHRGEIGVDDAIDFLVEHTGFERPNAAAEVHRYTSTPTYQLSYLLGKVLILRLREDEQRRLGADFSLQRFHDALLWSGSMPVSFHRRLLAGEGGGPFMPGRRRLMQVIPSIDLQGGRSRLVWWPGAGSGQGVADRPTRAHRSRVRGVGRAVIHLVDLDGARAGQPVSLSNIAEVARAVAVPLQVAGGVDGPEQIELCFAAGATRVVVPLWAVVEDRARLDACLAIAGDWLAVGLDARPERLRDYPWKRFLPPSLDEVVAELAAAGVRRFVLSHGGTAPDTDALGRLSALGMDVLVAGGVTSVEALPALAASGVAGVIVGEALFTGAIDLVHGQPGSRVAPAIDLDGSMPTIPESIASLIAARWRWWRCCAWRWRPHRSAGADSDRYGQFHVHADPIGRADEHHQAASCSRRTRRPWPCPSRHRPATARRRPSRPPWVTSSSSCTTSRRPWRRATSRASPRPATTTARPSIGSCPDFVIQGGDPDGTGRGGPGYTIQDEPVVGEYGRGIVAMARTSQPDSQGSQFFIVLDDGARAALEQFRTYVIFGEVVSGMDVVDQIAAMPNSGPPDNSALDPVVMDVGDHPGAQPVQRSGGDAGTTPTPAPTATPTPVATAVATPAATPSRRRTDAAAAPVDLTTLR